MTSPSWYSIDIYLVDTSEKVFSGCFTTDANDVGTGFYETINGITNFDNNLLVDLLNPTKQQYEKFIESEDMGVTHDNGYKEDWQQFDMFGVLLKNISYYSSDKNIRLSCRIPENEAYTNQGYIYQYINNNLDSRTTATFIINKIAAPILADKWYSIGINLNDDTKMPLLNGFFKTSAELITGFYETKDGKTDFNNNLLSDAGVPNPYLTLNGFVAIGIPEGNIDNGYKEDWKQFDLPGVLVSNISYFSNTDNIKYVNFYADKGDQLVSNIGTVFCVLEDGVLIDIPAAYTIKPISDPTCFNEGTKILCLNKKFEEEYIAIENLKKGDLVKSYKHGYRKIDLIGKNTLVNNPNKFNECMYKMEKTDENGLLEDLIVTGGHSILVDDLGDHAEENNKIFGETPKIDGKHLLLSCVSKDFTKIEDIQAFTYYHLTLENNNDDEERFGIWANGVLTETPSNKLFSSSNVNLI